MFGRTIMPRVSFRQIWRPTMVGLVVSGVAAGLVWSWLGQLKDVFDGGLSLPVLPAASPAGFDTYFFNNMLIYIKKPCNPEDMQPHFFLHIDPVDRADLPEHRKEFTFDNLDFSFSQYGTMTDNKCVAAVPLPDYSMSSIRTGQYLLIGTEGKFSYIWEEEFAPPPREKDRSALPKAFELRAGHPLTIMTHLHALQMDPVELEPFFAWGGAMESLGDDLLVATTRGRLALVSSNGTVNYLEGKVPMNEAGLESYDNPKFDPIRFRVTDILLTEHLSDRIELFVSHHYFNGECFLFRLSSTTLFREAGSIRILPDWKTVFDAEPCLTPPFAGEASGGKMLTDDPEHLLVIIGDFGRGSLSQDSDSHLGKLVRINTGTGHAEILTSGHRNPQGLARDKDGTLWATEHGPQGGDELNRLEVGSNYGWPYVSYGIEYGGRKLNDKSKVAQHEGYTKPVFSWVPSIASSSLVVNNTQGFPLWHDDLLVGSLVGSSNVNGTVEGRSIFRIRRHGHEIQYVEKIEIGRRVRDMSWMSDGRLALLSGNWVLIVRRSDQYCGEEFDWERDVYSLHCGSVADDSTGFSSEAGNQTASADRLFALHCGRCHRLTENEHTVGPHLVGVIGRRAGEVDGYYDFSPAFRALDRVWTREDLQRFLVAPQRFAPGTSMATPDISEAEARAIVDFVVATRPM